METSIFDFHQQFYIPEMQKLALQFPHVRNIRTNHCDNTLQEAFKHRSDFHNVLLSIYYSEHVVDIFSHQIQSVYYGGNIYFSIEGIQLEQSSDSEQEKSSSALHSRKHHALFHSFLPDNVKQDTLKTASHRKGIISLLKNRQLIFLV